MKRYLFFSLMCLILTQFQAQNMSVQDTLVYDFVEEDASFYGGSAAMHKYIVNNVRYPCGYGDVCFQGTVHLSFIVEKDGGITNVKAEKGLCDELDQEAIKLIQNMPNWTPAKNGGKVVRSRCRFPIKFSI